MRSALLFMGGVAAFFVFPFEEYNQGYHFDENALAAILAPKGECDVLTC